MSERSYDSGIWAAFAVASVWFATHFGGGFSSARQVVEFYTQYGYYALFMPILAIVIEGIIFYYGWSLAVTHKSFNYKKWATDLYEPYGQLGELLYEIMYIITVLIAGAVAFATGGSVLNKTLGINYYLATGIVAIIIFVITIYGAEAVRRFSSGVAVVGVILLIIAYGVVIIKNFSQLQGVVHSLKANPPASFKTALWAAILYAAFQSMAVGSYISVADVLKSRKDCRNTAIVGVLINLIPLWLCSIATLIFYPAVTKEAVPALLVMQTGIGNVAKNLISFLIFIGVVSTGVPFIYGFVKRILSYLETRVEQKTLSRANIGVTLIAVIVTWSVALFGLIPLIAKGYRFLGYLAIVFLIPPLLIKGILYEKQWWEKRASIQ